RMSDVSRRSNCLLGLCLTALLTAAYALPFANATRLPTDMPKAASIAIGGKVRLDGAVETADGQLYLLLVPPLKDQKKNKVDIDSEFPNAKQPDVVLYSNGWAHVRVSKRGDICTVSIKD